MKKASVGKDRLSISKSISYQQNVSAGFVVKVFAFLVSIWAIDYFVIRTPILTPFTADAQYLKALTPMYAFWKPFIRPQAIIFPIIAAFFIVSSNMVLKLEKVTSPWFAVYLFVSFCALAGSLYLVRYDLPNLAQNLIIYPAEEVYYDSQRMESIGTFIRDYKALQPELSMRGQHYPPGGAVFLKVMTLIFGEGLWKVGTVILATSGLGLVLCYTATRQILSEIQARQSSLLLAASPSLLNFTCTSMDAVFFFFASLCLLFCFMVGKQQIMPPTGPGINLPALLTGMAIYLACFMSFAAFTLGMCLASFIAVNGKNNLKLTTLNLSTIATSFMLCFLSFELLAGYSLLENISYAREHNFQFMASVLHGPVSRFYLYACYGNISAFLIGCGIAVVGAAFSSVRRSFFQWTPWRIATLTSLLIMTVGGMYTMETERIWIFAIPWMTIFAVQTKQFSIPSLRLLMSCGLLQVFVMEMLLFTLW
jgi:hypothetical protein